MARLSCGVLLVALSACPAPEQAGPPPYPAPQTESDGEVIATVGPVTFTTREIEKRIKHQSPFIQVQLQDPKKKALFVEEQIRNEVLAQEAWAQKLYDDARIQEELRRLMVQRVMKDHLQSIRDQIKVTETELRQAYREREDEFNKPAKIRVSQIVRYVANDKERKEARKLLDQVKSQVVARQMKNDHTAFADAARQHSEDENTKLGGGDLQFLTREQLAERYGEEVAKHLFDDVTVGDMAIAAAPNAEVLFKKTGSRRAVERTLEQVKPQVRGALIGEKRTKAFEAFVETLKKKHAVTIDRKAIEHVKVESGAAPAPKDGK